MPPSAAGNSRRSAGSPELVEHSQRDRLGLSGLLYLLSVGGAPPRPLTDGTLNWPGGWPPVVTPDGRYVLARERGTFWQIPIDGGERRALKGIGAIIGSTRAASRGNRQRAAAGFHGSK